MQEDKSYSVKVPLELTGSYTHLSVQLCLQIMPSLPMISPAKLHISVIASKKPVILQLGDGKATSHQG